MSVFMVQKASESVLRYRTVCSVFCSFSAGVIQHQPVSTSQGSESPSVPHAVGHTSSLRHRLWCFFCLVERNVNWVEWQKYMNGCRSNLSKGTWLFWRFHAGKGFIFFLPWRASENMFHQLILNEGPTYAFYSICPLSY